MLSLNDLFNKLSGNGPDKKDDNGDTRLYRAVRAGSVREVKKLLRAGADPNIKNSHNLSPLHQAAYWGETEIVELLLKAGADPNADNGRGWTPLHSAAVSGGEKMRKSIIDQLVKAGGDLARKDKHCWTPSDYMTLWQENAPAADKLKKHFDAELGRGAKITPHDLRKNSPPPRHFS